MILLFFPALDEAVFPPPPPALPVRALPQGGGGVARPAVFAARAASRPVLRPRDRTF